MSDTIVTANMEDLADADLNERVAVEVAGWRFVHPLPYYGTSLCYLGNPLVVAKYRPEFVHATPHPSWTKEQIFGGALPRYATDVSEVLPLLEKHPYVSIERVDNDGWQVAICYRRNRPEGGYEEGTIVDVWENTLARAMAVAVLAAARKFNKS